MATHGCGMCHGTGTISRINSDGKTENWTCSGCDGKGSFEAPEDQWSRRHISLPWNKKKGDRDGD